MLRLSLSSVQIFFFGFYISQQPPWIFSPPWWCVPPILARMRFPCFFSLLLCPMGFSLTFSWGCPCYRATSASLDSPCQLLPSCLGGGGHHFPWTAWSHAFGPLRMQYRQSSCFSCQLRIGSCWNAFSFCLNSIPVAFFWSFHWAFTNIHQYDFNRVAWIQ